MHARGVVPNEERLVGLLGIVAIEEVDHLGGDFLIHCPGSVQGQRPFVTASLLRLRAVVGMAPKHRPRGRQANCRMRINGARNLWHARDRRVAARRSNALNQRGLIEIREAHSLHRVEMVEVAPVFLEAVRCRQRRSMVAQMVLPELAGRVAEIEQEFGDRWSARPQVGRAAGQLGRDHAGAQRIHTGEEGIAPRGAALHGNVVHEDCALVPDAVDVRRFADHQATVVDARLHPADVIAHDEKDVGLLWLLR